MDLQVVIPLVEIEVPTAPFHFTALKIYGFRTKMDLCREKCTSGIRIHGHAVRIYASGIKMLNRLRLQTE